MLEDILRVASLVNYNTRLVVLATAMLGLASGLIGSFLLLRKRSLMGDALSHATLPGIALAFMVLVALGGSGKSLPGLLTGASITAAIGLVIVMAITRTTRLKDDAAMGIVLSVFYGLGVVILHMALSMPGGQAAGLESFIYGRAASMIMQDFILIAGITGVVALLCLLFFKEFMLVAFDDAYAGAQGWPIGPLDLIMLTLAGAVTVVGLQAVGLILIIAFLITPAAAARFWTESLRMMLILAGVIGAVSGWLGASISALLPNMPAGAVIVLVAAAIFAFSMLFGRSRGVLLRLRQHRKLKNKVSRQHLLRAVYELLETQAQDHNHGPKTVANGLVSFEDLLARRSWHPGNLRRLIRRQIQEDHVEMFDGRALRLTEEGFGEAARVTRNHRLWEMYLIEHADIAPSHVDRDADLVEHVLGPSMVAQLERALHQQGRVMGVVPTSPHTIGKGGGA